MSNQPTLDYSAVDATGRLAPGERVGVLWLLTLLGIGVSIMVSALYAAVKLAGEPLNTPTTQNYTPREMVLLNFAVPVAVLGALVAANVALRSGGLGRLGLGGRRLGRGLLIGTIAAIVIVPLVHTSAWVAEFAWQFVGLKHPTAHPLLRAGDELADPLLRGLIAFSAIVLAPAAEELLFRGHFQTAMVYSFDAKGTGARARWASIALTSIVFTIFHGELWMMPPIFLLSICLGYAYERTTNLWVPILIHALFNASSVAFFFYS